MQKLSSELKKLISKLSERDQEGLSDEVLDKMYTVYPFNKFEYIISHLIANGVLTLNQYVDIRSEYLNRNRYLYLFELAPRTFGETWGQRHLMELLPDFQIPSRKTDPYYQGEYDLILDDIHVEVKASRVVRKHGGETLAEKALNSRSNLNFDMNFQQLKPNCCDVFVWLAVWTDKIDYWVLPSHDIQANKHFSNQHRASQLKADGTVVEGQIHIKKTNYEDFNNYKVEPFGMDAAIRKAAEKQATWAKGTATAKDMKTGK